MATISEIVSTKANGQVHSTIPFVTPPRQGSSTASPSLPSWAQTELTSSGAQVVTIPASDAPQKINVTPALATLWLARNLINRNFKTNDYARQIQRDNWRHRFAHTPLAFTPDGRLLNGQNRLQAIIDTNTPVMLWAQFNVPAEEQKYMDGGKNRENRDVVDLHMRTHGLIDTPLNPRVTQIVQAVGRGLRMSRSKCDRDEIVNLVSTHLEATQFVLNLFPAQMKGITAAPVMAVFTRAFYSVDTRLLTEAAEVLKTSKATKLRHEVLIKLRDHLMGNTAGGSEAQYINYATTEYALQAFLQGKSVQRLKRTKEELFPLPGEAE